MGGDRDKLQGDHWDTDEQLDLRARTIRAQSINWLPPYRDYPVLRSVLIKPPSSVSEKWLVVVKAWTEEGDVVAFHKGTTLLSALSQALYRAFNGKIDWKPETPYRPPRGQPD